MPERGLPFDTGGGENTKPSRVEHGRRPERERRRGGDPVPSRAVHRRGQGTESIPVERAEMVRLRSLMDYIARRSEIALKLSEFIDSQGYKDTEGNLVETVESSLAQAREIARTYMADDSKDTPTDNDFDQLEVINTRVFNEINDLREALEELESQKKITIPDEIKALFSETATAVEPAALESGAIPLSVDGGDSGERPATVAGESGDVTPRPYSSFSNEELQSLWGGMRNVPMEKVRAVEDSLGRWQEFDAVIQKYGSIARFEEDLAERGLGDKYRETLALANQVGRNRERLAEVKKRLEETGELDKSDAGFLKAMFFGYHELLAAGESIAREREVEGQKIAVESEARQAAERERKEGVTDTDHEKSFAELREQIGAWDEMFAAIVAAKREKRLFKALRRTDERVLLNEEVRRKIHTHMDSLQADLQAGKKIGRSQKWLDRHRFGFNRLLSIGEKILKETTEKKDTDLTDPTAEPVQVTEDKGKVVVLAMGREVKNATEMTAWEKLDVEKSKAFRTLIGLREFNDFQAMMKRDLIAAGIDDAIIRQRAASKALEAYMPSRIRQLASKPEWNLVLTDAEIEKVFMESLRKNLFVS